MAAVFIPITYDSVLLGRETAAKRYFLFLLHLSSYEKKAMVHLFISKGFFKHIKVNVSLNKSILSKLRKSMPVIDHYSLTDLLIKTLT